MCPVWQQRIVEIPDIVEADASLSVALVLTGEDNFFCNVINLKLDKAGIDWFIQNMQLMHSR
jgi:hypothetical protein